MRYGIWVVSALLCLSATSVEAQSGYPDRFDTSGGCLTALESGQFSYYNPSFFKPIPLKAGEKVVPLEHKACVRMRIVGRVAWVPQPAGARFVFNGTEADRRADCGNKVYEVAYPISRELATGGPSHTTVDLWDHSYAPTSPLSPVIIKAEGGPWEEIIGSAALLAVGWGVACFGFGKGCIRQEQRTIINGKRVNSLNLQPVF